MANIEEHRVREADFERLVSPLVGLPITHAWRGYGSAIFFELGPLKRVRRDRRPGHSLKGVATVMLEGNWRIERRQSIEFGADSSDRRITNRLRKTKRLLVESVTLEGRLPELRIGLSEGRWVSSFMTFEGQPRWVLFLPDTSWLCVSRGRVIREAAAPVLHSS